MTLVPASKADSGDSMTPGYCETQNIVKIIGLVNGGSAMGCIEPYPSVVKRSQMGTDGAGADQVQLMFSIKGPDNGLGAVVTVTWSVAAVGGCTAVIGPAQADDFNAAITSSIIGYTLGTFTEEFCRGYVTAVMTFGAVNVARFRFPFNIKNTDLSQYTYQCAAPNDFPTNYHSSSTSCNTPVIDNLDYACASTNGTTSAFSRTGTTCNPPFIKNSVAITSWPALQLSGSITTTLAGTLDLLDRLCAASATGTTCNTATVNAVVSGTLDTLDRFCAASALGTSCTTPSLNAALSGTVNANLAGTLDVLSRLCNASATGTTCNQATVSAVLSGAITAHQDPVSGSLNVHQDQACGASFATRCYGELSGININQTVGNNTVVIPSNFTLQGGSIPIQVGNARGEFFLGVLAWVIAFFVCLRFNKLLSAGACTLGVVVSAMQLSLGWQAAAIGVLGITLWLEALGRDKIILAFFSPESDSSSSFTK